MSRLPVERPTNINFTSSYPSNNMSNASLSELSVELIDCEWEHYFGRLVQEWPIREQVSTALKEASAAFAAQITQPDGYKYMDACDGLAKFLDLKISLEQSEQKWLVQVLQVACAMHENAVNNPALTKTERSAHYLASTSLFQLCQNALDGSITCTDLWCEAFSLSCRAEKVLTNDLSKYLDFGNMNDDCVGGTSAAPPPVPTASGAGTPRASVHDITDVPHTPRSAKLKEKALAMLNDRPSKGAPLGRAHTMPTLSQSQSTPSSHSSRTGRAPSRGHGLQALQEIGE